MKRLRALLPVFAPVVFASIAMFAVIGRLTTSPPSWPANSQALAERAAPLRTKIVSPLACYVLSPDADEEDCWKVPDGQPVRGIVYCQKVRSGSGCDWTLLGDADLASAIIRKIRTSR